MKTSSSLLAVLTLLTFVPLELRAEDRTCADLPRMVSAYFDSAAKLQSREIDYFERLASFVRLNHDYWRVSEGRVVRIAEGAFDNWDQQAGFINDAIRFYTQEDLRLEGSRLKLIRLVSECSKEQ